MGLWIVQGKHVPVATVGARNFGAGFVLGKLVSVDHGFKLVRTPGIHPKSRWMDGYDMDR